MKNFKYWLVIIVRTIVSAATFYFLSLLFSNYEVKAELVTNRVQWLNGFNYSANFSNGNILHSQVSQNVTLTANYNYVVRIPVSYSFYAEDNSQIGTDHPVSTQFSLRSNYSYGVNETFCQLKDGYIECPISSSFKSIVYLWGYTPPDVTTTFIFNDAYEVVIVESTYYLNLLLSINSNLTEINKSLRDKVGDIDQSIKDQTEQQHKDSQATQDKIQEATDTITDSNTDDASSSAGGFFNDFDDESHGLSGIVSAPLSLIQKFSSNSCTPVSIPILGKSAALPCGNTFFNQPGVTDFVNVFNIICGSLIAYGAFCGIRKKVEDFKDPDNSKVEVLDL